MRIVHYFSPMSGYAYLGFGELCAVAKRHGASVEHRPVDIARVFAASETTAPAKQSPARLAWRRTDMARWALRRNLPLNVAPRRWPVDATLSARAIIAATARGFEVEAFIAEILASVWARDEDIADPETIASLATTCGVDMDIVAAAAAEDVGAAYELYTNEAIAAGVIGSPTVFVEDAMFFGQDRFDFLEHELRSRKAT